MTAAVRRWGLGLVLLAAACEPGPLHGWPDGRVVGRGHRSQVANEGYWSMFVPDGSRVTGRFVDGRTFGIWKYYDSRGVLRARTSLHEGREHGPAATWHADGTPESQGGYVDGRREGAWRFWTAAGAPDPARTGHYIAGVRQD